MIVTAEVSVTQLHQNVIQALDAGIKEIEHESGMKLRQNVIDEFFEKYLNEAEEMAQHSLRRYITIGLRNNRLEIL